MWDVDRERLPVWVIYESPEHYPGQVAARLWYTVPDEIATSVVLVGSLPTVRQALSSHGYIKVPRHDVDPPHVVETWL